MRISDWSSDVCASDLEAWCRSILRRGAAALERRNLADSAAGLGRVGAVTGGAAVDVASGDLEGKRARSVGQVSVEQVCGIADVSGLSGCRFGLTRIVNFALRSSRPRSPQTAGNAWHQPQANLQDDSISQPAPALTHRGRMLRH